jgi:arylsulfatase A-like enzyme
MIKFTTLGSLLILLSSSFALQAQSKKDRPNVILIMVDDMGYSDLGVYGSEINTPNLDKLANEGIRLQEFYNNAICAPTRASLLTGQYPHRAGIGYFDVDLGLPAYQGFLNKESLTIGEVMRNAGYSTLLSGKWHVGNDSLAWPNQRGFDQFYGIISGASNYFNADNISLFGRDYPVTLVKNNKRLQPEKNSYYFTDEVTNNAISFIENQDLQNKPFFLYVAYTAPHWPLQALPEDIAKYKGKYSDGWDILREQRFNRQKALGIIPSNAGLPERDSTIPDWNNLSYDEQQVWQSRMEVYAAMVDRMDQGVGKIYETLKRLKKDDNTVIIFLSDNGAEGGTNTGFRGVRIKKQNSGPVGTPDSFDYIYKNWSFALNTPLNGYKGAMFEGGISTSFIAWYPKKISPKTISRGTGHIIDIAPTIYDITGATYPKKYQQATTNSLVGKSLWPVFTGQTSSVNRDEPIFWERAGNRAVRKGPWKIVANHQQPWQLYNIENDRAETTNLAEKHPDIVRDLAIEYAQWTQRTGVVDYETIKYNVNTTRK